MLTRRSVCFALLLSIFVFSESLAGPRARDLGIPFDGTPGEFNAITDVAGVEVGHVTLNSGGNEGGVRTGVTTIFPLGKTALEGVPAATFSYNGTGEMTGTHFIKEIGGFFGPIALTGTLSVGVVRDALIEWSRDRIEVPQLRVTRIMPVVAETFDGGLNDAWGFHVKKEHVFEALDNAQSGPVAEGSVGGGTGMVAYQLKAGIGTSSRLVQLGGHTFTVGALVQANHGNRDELTIAGVPVGKEITDLMPVRGTFEPLRDGSIIVIIATDIPLLPTQLARLARHVTVGVAKTGGQGNVFSGDIFLAFSTGNKLSAASQKLDTYSAIPITAMDPVFDATIQATEEAIINALIAAETMEGGNGGIVHELPHKRLKKILKKYNRLEK